MATIPKAILDLLTNSKTAKFAESLKHSDLPTGWADDPEIVDLAAKAWQEAGTESPFFKAWFGGSKVVDDAGKPQVFYHGSNNVFDAFDPSKIKENRFGKTFNFINDPDYAGQYGDNIYSVYLKQDSPLTLDDLARDVSENEYLNIAKALNVKNPSAYKDGISLKRIIEPLKDSDTFIDVMNAIKRDGFSSQEEGIRTVINPEQLKSVNNRGTFNPSDPNIYRTLAPLGVGTAAMAAALLGDGSEAEAAPTRWLQALVDNPKTAAFAKSLKHSDLPENWADDPEIVGLAEKAWKESGTDSPFFKAWFGNSKVVDDAGKPLTVYHGSGVDNIDVFRKSKIGNLGPAIYFTPNQSEAVKYAASRNGGDGGSVYDVFVKSQKPWKISGSNASPEEFWAKIPGETEAETIKNLKKKGYDSVWAGDDEIAIYDPKKIKSVNNRGTFNPNDPNIYRSLAPVGAGTAALAASLLAGGDEAKAAAINAALADPASREKAAAAGLPYDPPVEESAWSPADLLVAPVGAVGIPAKLLAMALDAPVTLGLDAGLSALGGLFGGGERKKPGGW